MSVIITRYAEPNEFDLWPLGTECRVYLKDNEYEVYIQRSKDQDKPIWEYTGIEYING